MGIVLEFMEDLDDVSRSVQKRVYFNKYLGKGRQPVWVFSCLDLLLPRHELLLDFLQQVWQDHPQ